MDFKLFEYYGISLHLDLFKLQAGFWLLGFQFEFLTDWSWMTENFLSHNNQKGFTPSDSSGGYQHPAATDEKIMQRYNVKPTIDINTHAQPWL